MTVSEWLSLLGSVSTICAAGVAGWVAHRIGFSQIEVAKQQAAAAASEAEVAKNKLKLDLFERRLNIYETITEYISEYINEPYQSVSSNIHTVANSSAWLFGEDVHLHLKDIILPQMWAIAELRNRIQNADQNPVELISLSNELSDMTIDLVTQSYKTATLVKPYLTIQG
jgi:hypothetical protein